MTYGFDDFIWLILITWLISFVLHQVIGGLIGIYHRGVLKKNVIAVTLKDKP